MTVEQEDLLGDWVAGAQATAAQPPAGGASGSDLRFAFYGRTSAVEYQDWFSSYGWEREMAEGRLRRISLMRVVRVGCREGSARRLRR